MAERRNESQSLIGIKGIPNAQTALDRQEAEDYQGPKTLGERISESSIFRKGIRWASAALVATQIFGASPKEASADKILVTNKISSQDLNVSNSTSPKNETVSQEAQVIDIITGEPYYPLTDAEKQDLKKNVMNAKVGEPVLVDLIQRSIKDANREMLAEYIQSLKDKNCTEDLVFYAKFLNLVKNVKFGSYDETILSPDYTYITNYIDEDGVYSASMNNGEGLDIYEDKGSKILLFPSSEKINEIFDLNVKWHNENGAENYIQTLSDNGTFMFYFIRFDPVESNTSVSNYGSEGYTQINVDSKLAEKESIRALTLTFKRDAYIESIGTSLLKFIISQGLPIGGNEIETVKFWLASYNYEYLYQKTKNKDYQDLSKEFLLWAKSYFNPNKKNLILRFFEVATKSGLVKSLGTEDGAWGFIEGMEEITLD